MKEPKKKRKHRIASNSLDNLSSHFWKKEFPSKGCKTAQDFLDRKNACIAEYVGNQTKYNNKMSESDRVFFCNATGQMQTMRPDTYERFLKEYGTREAIQKHFISARYRQLVERYGRAWLYLQLTPRFQELRRKLRLLIFAYNTNTKRTMADYKKYYNKMKVLTRKEGIPILKPILHKKTDNHIDGVWLKGIPFVYGIFITSEETPPNWVDVEPEDIPEDRDDDNPPEKEYFLDEVKPI